MLSRPVDKCTEHLSHITDAMEQFADEGEIILLGNLQTFPANVYNNLKLIDGAEESVPNYTYHNNTLNHKSYIDRTAVLHEFSYDIEECKVHAPHELDIGHNLLPFH